MQTKALPSQSPLRDDSSPKWESTNGAQNLSDRIDTAPIMRPSPHGRFRRRPKLWNVWTRSEWFCLRGVKPQIRDNGSLALSTGELGMELSPKGTSFGEGSARKCTVQEASWPSSAFHNSSVPGREKRSETGAREARSVGWRQSAHPQETTQRGSRAPDSHGGCRSFSTAPAGAHACVTSTQRLHPNPMRC